MITNSALQISPFCYIKAQGIHCWEIECRGGAIGFGDIGIFSRIYIVLKDLGHRGYLAATIVCNNQFRARKSTAPFRRLGIHTKLLFNHFPLEIQLPSISKVFLPKRYFPENVLPEMLPGSLTLKQACRTFRVELKVVYRTGCGTL
ncbi:hypothetical protein TNIN_80461 [Trichonephila inaurata madagascariensis]|uniref:Uncharacterized protein n=1 Tax=Trichonephila inaurata madagascariensis TaxID=2747483 RepID=A0A8X7C0J5_9ARAC|nr:hypothetical protein TNIN_80461 [Trichonephila inaurata madagascariensis]